MRARKPRDVETASAVGPFVAKLRRLADKLETGEAFTIAVAGERIRVPKGARLSVEHERADGEEELEFQLKWSAVD